MKVGYPIEEVRRRFPSLDATDEGRPRVYLDNPAGTQVESGVIDAVTDCYRYKTANLDGLFTTSRLAGEVIASARHAMADFLGTDHPAEIVIGPSMTALTFHMSRSICRDFKAGDEIIVTRMDHEGNVAPWLHVARDMGLVIRWADFNRETWRVEKETITGLLSDRTKLVALNYASNMTGAVNDVAAISRVAKQVGALVYVDAVQFAPHRLLDVRTLGCDFLTCSAYKFFGPHLGVMWGRRELLETLHPYKCRCSDDVVPSRFEVGTPAIELFAGLAAAVDHFAWSGSVHGETEDRRARIATAFAASGVYEDRLAQRLLDGLSAIDDIRVIGPSQAQPEICRVPTISIRHERVPPQAIARALAAENIFVWHGHNYAYETARTLGIEADGVLRIGIAHYNTAEEITQTVEAVSRAVTGN